MSPTSDVQQYLKDGLETINQMMLSQIEDYHPDLKAAARVLLASNGKKIRPRVILLIGRMLGADEAAILRLAASIEMLHTATLVHDDLIDGALLRRGIPTLNANWSPAATVLTGDFLFASASDMAVRLNSHEVMGLFSRTLMTIVNGEVTQYFMQHAVRDIDAYFRLIYAKTASLFETSAHAAALVSNTDPREVDLLRRFGYAMGMAFQIVDDILDYTGDEASIGKPVGGDLRHGLVTLPLLHYMSLNPDDPSVEKLNSRQRVQEDDIQHLFRAIHHSNAIRKTQDDAEEFANRAEACITRFPAKPEREALREIARQIVNRKN